MKETLTLEFDGGSRGNPGPAGIGVVLRAADGTPLVTLGRFIGRATNNAAEYRALVTALEQAKRLGAKKVAVRGDSELIIKQMRGEYRVKNPDLRVLYEEAQDLLNDFEEATFTHNLRHHNSLADALANKAMDRKADVTEIEDATSSKKSTPAAAPSPLDAPTPKATQPGDRFVCARCGCVIAVEKPSGVRPHQLRAFGCQCGFGMSGEDELR